MTPPIPWRSGLGGPRAKAVLTVKAGDRWPGILLCHGQDIPGCDVHWCHESRQSIPCIGTGCPRCAEGGVPQWKGYAPVLVPLRPVPYSAGLDAAVKLGLVRMRERASQRVALEITGQCWSFAGCAPGTIFCQSRAPGRANGRLELAIPEMPRVEVEDGAWFDTRPLVQAMWSHHFKGGA